jgi:hypothetical protein
MRRKQPWVPVARFAPLVGLSALVLFVLSPGLSQRVAAQEQTPQAGLVIQFGEGNLQTACVELGPDGEATGEEVLRAAGFDTVIDYTSGFGGGTVCKVDAQGCNFPAEACFCQCTMRPGDPCVYWTYFRLIEGQWRYSNLGVSNTTLRPGEVEAWVWGPGGTSAGAAPPVITFDEICGASSEAAVVPSATPSPPPSETAPALVAAGATQTRPPASATALPDAPDTRLEEPPLAETALTATTTVTPQGAAAKSVEAVQVTAVQAPATEAQEEGAGSLMGYAVFGVLVLLLGGGLLVMKGRGSI